MNELDELIATAEKLCESLDKASENEKKLCLDICHNLEILSWETLKITNDLKQIREYHQGA